MDELVQTLKDVAPWALDIATRAAVWNGVILLFLSALFAIGGWWALRKARRIAKQTDDRNFDDGPIMVFLLVFGTSGVIVGIILFCTGLHYVGNPQYHALKSFLP